jgi:hypothetical protein
MEKLRNYEWKDADLLRYEQTFPLKFGTSPALQGDPKVARSGPLTTLGRVWIPG